MAIYHTNFEQRSAEWYRIRLGIPTASEMDNIITPTKGELSAGSKKYMNRLLAEWILGTRIEKDPYESEWMQHGKDTEAEAAKAFEFQTDLKTSEVGFVTTDDGLIGCSPDRLVESWGTLELKCPAPHTQVGYLLDGGVAKEYRVQTQAQIWICEREKSYVMSYHDQLPNVLLPVDPDEDFIAKMTLAVRKFTNEMLEKRLEWVRRFGEPVRPDPKKTAEVVEFGELGVSADDVEAIIAANNK